MKKLSVAILLTCLCTLFVLLSACSTVRPFLSIDPATGKLSLTDTETGVTVSVPLPEPSK